MSIQHAPVTWWAAVSSITAPVVLIGGWTIAASRRPGFDSTTQSISALAATGAPHRWIMTTALVVVGLCHLTTAIGLRPAPRAGRLAFGVGGLATLGVALAPLPAGGGGSAAHTLAASLAFVALACWPLLTGRPAGRLAGVALLALVAWFAVELWSGGAHLGLAERVAAGAQSLWPALAVGAARARSRSAR